MATVSLHDIQPRYMWLDPGSGKRGSRIRSTRARSSIVVVGVSPDTRVWVLDAWADRVGTSQIVAQFCNRVEKWKPTIAAYEDMAQQALLFDPINEEAEMRGIVVPLSPITVSTRVDKDWRIRTILQPLVSSGRLMLNEQLVELKNEVTNFPMAAIKDEVDALAGACSLIPPPAAQLQSNDETRDIAAYLRANGVPPAQIESVVREAGGYAFDEATPKWQRDLRRTGRRFAVRS